jgi:hypothetical protein
MAGVKKKERREGGVGWDGRQGRVAKKKGGMKNMGG